MNTEAELATLLELMKLWGWDVAGTSEGTFFQPEHAARIAADQHDKDLVQIGGGWLAKNRTANPDPMPTKDGDVVIYHLNQLFRVWLATSDGAQAPDPNVQSRDFWNREDAENNAREWASDTNGAIYRLQKEGVWTALPK